MDLNELSLAQLKKLQRDVERAIASFEQRQLSAARTELAARARELGFSLAQLVAADKVDVQRNRATVQAKYRNPKNPKETWTGRGRKPRWLTVALTSVGTTLKDFAV